jgi:hypothetical protein
MFDKQMEHSVRVGVLGGSRRRLDGIGRAPVPGRQPLQVPSRRRCQAGAGRLGIDTGGKAVFVGLDAAAAESGDAWAGFWPARRARPGLPPLVISGGRPG